MYIYTYIYINYMCYIYIQRCRLRDVKGRATSLFFRRHLRFSEGGSLESHQTGLAENGPFLSMILMMFLLKPPFASGTSRKIILDLCK